MKQVTLASLLGIGLIATGPSWATTFNETTYSDWDIFGSEKHFEVKWGNGAANGVWEIAIKNGGDVVSDQQATWTSGDANPFKLTHNATTGELTFEIGGTSSVWDYGANSAFGKISILAKSSDDQDSSVSNLEFNSNSLINGSLSASNSKEGVYLESTNGLFSDFTVSGELTLNSGNKDAGSAMYIGVDDVQVVPIPAAAWLFGSALMGMAGIGYRRKKQTG
jgi:hypothetical protein